MVAIQKVVRRQLLAARHEGVGQQFKAPLIAMTGERDAAPNGRARAEQVLISCCSGVLEGRVITGLRDNSPTVCARRVLSTGEWPLVRASTGGWGIERRVMAGQHPVRAWGGT